MQRAPAGSANFSPIATGVMATSFTDSGLTNGVTYRSVVTAVNAAGVSLARDLQPVFTARCTTQFCHGTASQVALLHLAPGFTHGSLVDVSSRTSA